jgi:hypothetical protein
VVRVEPEQKAIGTVRVVEVQPELALVRPVAPVQVRDVQLKDLVIHVESGPAVAGERAIWATRADEDKAKAKDDKDKEKTAKALEEAMRKLQDAAAKSDLPPEARKQLEEAQKRLAEVQKQTQAAMERARVEAERAAREGAAAQKEYAEAVRRARSVYVAGALGSGRLGIHLSPVSDVLAEHLGLGKGKGLVIEQVLADSAAAKAGLQPHDILLEFNGQEIGGDLGDFAKKYFADVKPGAAVDAVVLRKGKKVTVKGIVLTEAKEGKEDKDDKKYRFRVELDGKPTPKVQAVPGVPATPGIPATPVTPALPAMPPMPAMPRLAMGGHGNTVMTTVIRDSDRFTTRHQEGSLIITVTGTVGDGKAKIKEIVVQDGTREEKYDRASEVPDRYRDKVKNLVEMSEKGQVKVEVRGGKAKD